MRNDEKIPTTLSSKQDQCRAKIVQRHFDCMISEEEKKRLLAPGTDLGEKAVLLQHLDHLIVALFVLLHFQRHGDYKSKVPPGLKKKMEGKSALKVCTGVCESTCV